MSSNPDPNSSASPPATAMQREADLLARVLRNLLSDTPYSIEPLGGEATGPRRARCYKLTSATAAYFLEVQHLSVVVERGDADPSDAATVPTLRHAHAVLAEFAGQPWVPIVHGYHEEGGYAFLLLEWLASCGVTAAVRGVSTLTDALPQIENALQALSARGWCHPGLDATHVLFREGTPVLAGFAAVRPLAPGAAEWTAAALLRLRVAFGRFGGAPSSPTPATEPSRRGAGHAAGPRVSIVLPVYNHRRFLPQAIASVLGQRFGSFELIIVNDGSTDGTREFLEELRDPRIRVLHQDNRRLPSALNAGFAAARGELLTWISADNHCAPMFLPALVGALDQHPEAGFAYSAFAWIDEHDRITGVHRDQEVSYRSLLKQNPGIAAFMYRRACQEVVGLYDPALDGAEDWDMWLRIAEQWPAVYVPEILYYYRLHGDSMTARIPERVAAASRQVVRNAIARAGDRLDVERLYPTLTACDDRATAEFYATLDFGTALLTSPFAPPELAIPFLEHAVGLRPDPVAHAHWTLACGRAGRWTDVARGVAALRAAQHPEVQRLVGLMTAAAQHQQNEPFFRIAPFALGRTGVELFEREAARRRVFAFTEPTSLDTGVPVLPIAQPPAPSGVEAAVPAAPQSAPRATATPSASRTVNGPAAPSVAKTPAAARPMVSVVVPTHDRPEMLREALASILAQTYRDFEIIVVNDAGSDVHAEVAALDTEQRITYVSHARNRGLAAARNTGIGAARGKYIAYLDDDDRFYPEHLEVLVGHLEGGGGSVAYSDALRVMQVKRDDRYVVWGRDLPYSNDFDRARLLVHNQFPVLCVMHARTCVDAVGGFDEDLTSHEDWEMWLRLSARFHFEHLRNVTAEFSQRLDGSSMTSSMKPDFLRTLGVIYDRYAADVAGRPDVQEARERFAAGLRAQLARDGSAPQAAAPAPGTGSASSTGTFDVSIVIPVFNRADLTEQCLQHLAEATTGATYEVIVVDNASTDRTAELLASLSGDVQIVRNTENLGFAVACNQGARAARGRYVVFLNNDTIPLPGWLEPLVKELDENPAIAVVGSKLLYADGRVQHAGVVFLRETPAPCHLFSGAPGDTPRVNRRRELNAVTGACMAVRAPLFQALGGFDEGFRNGFEDVDFCLRVRQQGHTIVYQPLSVLYHLESQTPGRKQHDEANAKRLIERWAAAWWWIGDEDLLTVPEGFGSRVVFRGDVETRALVPFASEVERAAWQLVADAQRALRANDIVGLRDALSDPERFPEDLGVLYWATRLARVVAEGGVQAAEAAALQR
jgi:GT2 family glycosyltransferase